MSLFSTDNMLNDGGKDENICSFFNSLFFKL